MSGTDPSNADNATLKDIAFEERMAREYPACARFLKACEDKLMHGAEKGARKLAAQAVAEEAPLNEEKATEKEHDAGIAGDGSEAWIWRKLCEHLDKQPGQTSVLLD
ncbi:hypothetical protein FN846DRAFT_1025728 [Sphaerosporella brunnea]|uniref:Uncharacterized protein n=1 Tax=Sphaerosporella brunnea TaxID=1250544 RepID=A0A5J5EDS7_9PEZI|nr:hypothetical protein FN846DRAFT_1025728 [Sphaerosporella brunnea]